MVTFQFAARRGATLALIVAAVLCLAAPIAAAQEAPDAIVKRVATDVIASIKSDPAIQAGNEARIKEVLEAKLLPNFDFTRMTALTMGKNWRAATPEQQKRLRGMDVAPIHVNGETRAYTRDLVEERAPGRHVEELRDELAPGGEPGPVEIRYRDAVAREPRDFGEGLVRSGEVGGVDDEAVGQRHEIVEMPRVAGRRSRPPEEHGQVGHQQGDDDARHAFIEVAAHAREDLLVQDRLRAVGLRHMTVELDRRDDAVPVAIAEQNDGA